MWQTWRMGERRRIPKKSISRHMWRHILTVGAWIIIFIMIWGRLTWLWWWRRWSQMSRLLLKLKQSATLEGKQQMCPGEPTNVSASLDGWANKCKSGRVSQAKQIDALEMRAPHVSVWFPLERGPICNEVRVSEAFQIWQSKRSNPHDGRSQIIVPNRSPI